MPVDGSANSDRAVRYAAGLAKSGAASVVHLLNVQPSVGSLVTMFVPRENVDAHHRDEGEKALASARKICADTGVTSEDHISVGRPGVVIGEFATRLKCGLVVLGSRGHSGLAGVVMGSVAQDVVAHVEVPVCLVK